MAVKTTVSTKRPTAKKKAKATKAKAKNGALQLTAAQWKNYQKAYTAAYQNRRINAAARALRARKQQSANKAIQQYATARHKAQAASIAAYAAQQSANQAGDAQQNAALRARVNANLRTHLSVLAKAQYSEASSRNYMQQAVQQTQTAAAAHTYEEKAYKVSTRISKISYKPAASAIAAAVKANAQAQSASASLRSPGAKTSTSAARGRTSIHATSVHQSGKANRTPRAGQRSQAAVAKSSARSHATAAKSIKATSKAFAARTAPKYIGDDVFDSVIFQTPPRPVFGRPFRKGHSPLSADYGIPVLNEFTGWYSNEDEPVCILAALANHLLLTTGFHLYQDEMKQLNSAIRYQRQQRLLPSGQDLLSAVMAAKSWPFSDRLRLKNFWAVRMSDEITPGMIIGYEAETGPHAAVLMPGYKVISWGEEHPLTASIEEALVLEWEVYGGRPDRGQHQGAAG